MEKFSLAEALRYITAGFLFLGSLWFYSPGTAKELSTALGAAGTVGVSLAFGAILYPVYRGCVYNWLMPRLQDLMRTKALPNYRTHLRDRYGLKGTATATRLYVALRDPKIQTDHDALIANVHLGYMGALIFLCFGIASYVHDKDAKSWFLAASAVVFVGTFLFERRFQSDELLRLLENCPPEKIQATAQRLDIKLTVAPQEDTALPDSYVQASNGAAEVGSIDRAGLQKLDRA